MPHGQPDFSATSPKVTTYSLSDMAELAARLGSIVTFDRRGDVVCMDDFERPKLRWLTNEAGAGTSVRLSDVWSRSGINSVLMTVGSTTNNYGDIWRRFGLPVASRIGLEVSFTEHSHAMEFIISGYFYDGTNSDFFSVKHSNVSNKISVYTPTGYVEAATKVLSAATSFIFHTMKLVIDYDTGKYVRLILDDEEYDLSGYSMATTGDTSASHISMWIRVNNPGGSGPASFLDDFIMTQNEP